jgi:hypothetical protein
VASASAARFGLGKGGCVVFCSFGVEKCDCLRGAIAI